MTSLVDIYTAQAVHIYILSHCSTAAAKVLNPAGTDAQSLRSRCSIPRGIFKVLDVSPQALDVPDIDSYIGLMHTLFTLEDRYGLEVCESDGEAHLRVNIRKGRDAEQLSQMLEAWQEQAAKLSAGEISREEYDRWRYHYPDLDTSGQWHKVMPPQGLSDMLIDALNDNSDK